MESKKSAALALAIMATAIWGMSFSLMKYALGFYGTLTLLALRFSLAALIAFAYLAVKKEKITGQEWHAGGIAGIVLFMAFAAQTYGQALISPSHSAFITGLYIIFVPIMAAGIARKPPDSKTAIAVILGLAGLWLLTGGIAGAGTGEALTFLCAIGFAAHIIVLSKYPTLSALRMTAVQIVVAALLSSAATALFERGNIAVHPAALAAIAALAIFATLFAYFAQTFAQQIISAEKIAMIFISEPV
ncbi:MAG TPA: DMT family transporter, partial [Candidatus Micrarchaeota archaeon]|nr:DMT family transporter [Candidatus Micrarchaeota archaeon]